MKLHFYDVTSYEITPVMINVLLSFNFFLADQLQGCLYSTTPTSFELILGCQLCSNKYIFEPVKQNHTTQNHLKKMFTIFSKKQGFVKAYK